MKNPTQFTRLAGRYLLSFLAVSAFSVVVVSTTAFAQGNSVCKGDVVGIVTNANANVGKTSFDSHGKPTLNLDDYTNLALVGQGMGLAPGSLGDAACSERVGGNYAGNLYDHRLKGWAWNENLGFISLSCEGGKNNSGAVGGGAACGAFDYGVYVSPPVNGVRALRGFAWNPVVGWMQFDSNFDNSRYAVKADANGRLSGYAWTSAGLWVNFTGSRVELFANDMDYSNDGGPGQNEINPVGNDVGHAVFDPLGEDLMNDVDNDGVPNDQDPDFNDNNGAEVDSNWCAGKPFFCAEVDPMPAALGLNLDASADGGVKIADGKDGYFVHLYFRNAAGNGAMPANYDFNNFKNGISFAWDDTVKANQTTSAKARDSLDRYNNPWLQSNVGGAVRGGVNFKPVTMADFQMVPNEPWHYVSKKPVSSYAPTSGSNVSFTNTEPPYPFDNESFINPIDQPELLEKNELILSYIKYPALKDIVTGLPIIPAGSALPNGKPNGEKFRFRPAVEVKTLYSGSKNDNISASRGVAIPIRVGVAKYGSLDAAQIASAGLNFKLFYPNTQEAKDEMKQAQGCGDANFNFAFRTNISGDNISARPLTALSARLTDFLTPQAILKEVDLQAMATLPPAPVVEVAEGEEPVEPPLPCTHAEAPSLYTKVSYRPDARDWSSVTYYSNKLPKSAGDIQNPSIVVHGNIYGQDIGNVNDDNKSQLVGNPAVNVVRDAIGKSLEKYGVATLGEPLNEGTCEVKLLRTVTNVKYTVRGLQCRKDLNYRAFTIGDENVLYFKGRDVVLNLTAESTENRWVIIADGGNIFINTSIDNQDIADERIVLVALRDSADDKYFKTGHAYVAGGKSMTIDATMVLDGSLFSYDPENPDFDDNGVPQWPDATVRGRVLNYQLLMRGSIYSDNTIGGADLDSTKDYLLAGAGEIIETPVSMEDRLRAQAYDLNYLRLFTLKLEICDDGTPRDQACGRCLTTEDIFAIANEEILCGEKGNCLPENGPDQEYVCNGINATEAYDSSSEFSDGDLMPPPGLDLVVPDGSDPVYVYYRAPAKDSFVFKN